MVIQVHLRSQSGPLDNKKWNIHFQGQHWQKSGCEKAAFFTCLVQCCKQTKKKCENCPYQGQCCQEIGKGKEPIIILSQQEHRIVGKQPLFGDSDSMKSEIEIFFLKKDPGRVSSSQQDVTTHPWRWPSKGSVQTDHYSCSHCCNTIS